MDLFCAIATAETPIKQKRKNNFFMTLLFRY
jgi:hypothetical protein